MTPARMRRLASDYEEVKKNFAGHKNIIVTPIGDEPPEKYHVTYFVNGIYLLPDGRIETLGRHEVEITLHAEYPRYKPICKIMTPIWHPNFRDGQICIGDIWGAGESLSDIIINIGDMIQYKSWNSYSPLSSEAAQWAMENKHLFPVGNIELFYSDYASAKDAVEIDVFEETPTETPASPEPPAEPSAEQLMPEETDPGTKLLASAQPVTPAEDNGNDFEITAEELAGIEYVPTAQRMQSVSHGGLAKGQKVNFKTILVKGLLWALIGALLGFGISEVTGSNESSGFFAGLFGQTYLAEYYSYDKKADAEFDFVYKEFKAYCRSNGIDPDSANALETWYLTSASDEAKQHLSQYSEYDDQADEALYNAYKYEFQSNETKLTKGIARVTRYSTALWSSIIALFIGLFLGLGEGVFYGSKEKAVQYAAIGAGISLAMGFVSGYLAQWMYSLLLGDDPSLFASSLVRGVGWAIMGVGIGLAVGLIKPTGKRILYCCLGGMIGAFIGGFLFNYVCKIIPDDIAARAVAVTIMGSLIGIGVGLLEQFAKQAWLKVIRGEFEGKEYLVFAGTTSIGNNGKNTIVLFKDKLVGPHHCDIILDGSKYVLVDCGTPMGTIVNGMKTSRHVLRQGDAIAIGNSVLVFNTK